MTFPKGELNNYSLSYAPASRRDKRDKYQFHDWGAKAYQDMACKKVRDKYGILKCTECCLPDCNVTEKELAE